MEIAPLKLGRGGVHVINNKWDLIIAHPPCTYLTAAGAVRLYKPKGVLNEERLKKGIIARDLFMRILWADCDKVVIENPTPLTVFCLPPYSQVIQPYEHGEPYRKKTCLWIKGVAPLLPTNIVEPTGSWVSAGSFNSKGERRKNIGIQHAQSERSKTFHGIARAMAEQWG